MAAPIVVFVPNEFYELHNPTEVPALLSGNHPHPQLLPFKTVMVADTSFDGERVVFKWPSYRSLAYFDSEKLHILPKLDLECPISRSAASRIVKRPIDPVYLCFGQGWTIDPWVHDVDLAMICMRLVKIPEEHLNDIQMHRMRTDHFYALSWTDLPEEIAARLKGFPRVAWVSRQFEGQATGQDPTLHVEVRVPSRQSVNRFEQSVSSALPDFDRVHSFNAQFAMLFLKRIVPIHMCFQLRRHRDFWINEDQERIHDNNS